MSPEFKEYQKQVLKNAKVLAKALLEKGYKLVSGLCMYVCVCVGVCVCVCLYILLNVLWHSAM